MAVNIEKYTQLKSTVGEKIKLVAVSKVRTVEEIRLMYNLGQRDFGENYVQELVAKQLDLPNDIRWHFIGHLQSNKVKYIAPFIHMIQGVDSFKLLEEIDRQAALNNRVINCLFQIHIAQEESKFGLSDRELKELTEAMPKYKLAGKLLNVKLCGLMGMASMTENQDQVVKEFKYLKCLFDDTRDELNLPSFKTLSMGMSGDYPAAIQEGSNMVRIGSLLFGSRINNTNQI
ncbi:MAG: YggS family pyridoxal phosphate-dependent enzyme [Chitinophagaceae bacterium]